MIKKCIIFARLSSSIHLILSFLSFSLTATSFRISKALQEAYSSISYVKMITPKSMQEKSDGVTRIVLPGGEDNKGAKKPMTNWHGRNLDPDSVARHNRSLKRAGFLNNQHAKGIF
jgi:hypothetical protein